MYAERNMAGSQSDELGGETEEELAEKVDRMRNYPTQ